LLEELGESVALGGVGVDDGDVRSEESQSGESGAEELSAFFGEDLFLLELAEEGLGQSSDRGGVFELDIGVSDGFSVGEERSSRGSRSLRGRSSESSDGRSGVNQRSLVCLVCLD
jgi:hypothetical protein